MSVERDPMRQRILIVLACFGAVVLLTNLALVTATDFGLRIEKLQLPVVLGGKPKGESLGLGENVGYGGFIYSGFAAIHGGPDNRMQVLMGFSRRRDPGGLSYIPWISATWVWGTDWNGVE